MKSSILFLLATVLVNCSQNQKLSEENLTPFNSIENGAEIVAKNNEFAFEIFKKIEAENQETNTFFSPVSLSLALAMTYNGAETTTKQAFENTLFYTDFSREEINFVNKNLIEHLFDDSSGSLFKIANSIWMNEDFTIKQSFINVVENNYFAKASSLDFSDANSVKQINNWVTDNTEETITKIIDETNSNAIMYLINAIYFKGIWKNKFDENNTQKLPFTNKNETKNVATMYLKQKIDFFENDVFSAVKLPYKEDKFSMTIFLPKNDKNLENIYENLTQENWKNWNTDFKSKELSILLPKFKFSYQQKLNEILKNSGLNNAFSNEADFSGLANIDSEISNVLQKTFIDVNEKGTEASAVTVVEVGVTSAGTVSKFEVDKPFLFIITENNTNSICFIGKINMPVYEN